MGSTLIDIAYSLAAMLVTLGILVTIHEYGHFSVARWCGVKVERFAIGFGKPLLRWRGKPLPGERPEEATEYVICALPLGGYVRMLGEQDDVPLEDRSRAFTHKTLPQRAAIVAAGPIANFLLAIVVYWLMFMTGVSGLAPVVGSVRDDGPAAVAGLRAGDEILAIDGTPTETWQDVRVRLLDRLGETGALDVRVQSADGEQNTHTITLNRWLAGSEEPDLLGALGMTPFHQHIPARLGDILPDGRAQAAGLQANDLIVSADGVPVRDWAHWLEVVQTNPERTLQVTVLRDGASETLALTPAVRLDANGQPELNSNGNRQGYIGAQVSLPTMPADMQRNVSYSPFSALPQAISETWDNSVFVLVSIKKMLIGLISVSNISGPITIAQVAGETASYGLEYYLGFLAVLSISLGVLNLLPIPVLDGGHLFYYAIEGLIRRPVPRRVQEWSMQFGVLIVAGIMFLAIYNDVNRLL
jgi:regulator of sigma E protease